MAAATSMASSTVSPKPHPPNTSPIYSSTSSASAATAAINRPPMAGCVLTAANAGSPVATARRQSNKGGMGLPAGGGGGMAGGGQMGNGGGGGGNTNNPHSVDSGISSPRSNSSSTLYSPKITGTSPSLGNSVSDTVVNASNTTSSPDKAS